MEHARTRIRAGSNGTVWVTISTSDEVPSGAPELVVGTRTYVSNGESRRYLINLVP